MNSTFSQDSNFISSKEAALKLKCWPEYIAQLCREGKFVCRQTDGEWRIESASLQSYLARREDERLVAKRELAERRKKEYQANAQVAPAPVVPLPIKTKAPVPVAPRKPYAPISRSTISRFVAQGALVVLFYGAFISSPFEELAQQGFSDVTDSLTSIPQLASLFDLGGGGLASVSSGFGNAGNVFSSFISAIGNRFTATSSKAKDAVTSGLIDTTAAPPQIKVVKVIETVREIEKPTYITNVINNTTIRQESASVAPSGISQGYVDTELQKLKNSLSSEVFKFTSTQFPSAPGISQSTANLAVSSRIDRLGDVAITDGTITGSTFSGGSISDSSVSASSLAVSGGTTLAGLTATSATISGTLTVSGAQTLYGVLTVPNFNATSTTEASSVAYRLGIGTTTPSEALSIHGNAYTSGSAFFGGALTATSTLSVQGLSTLAGLFSTASSTIGGGTQTTGLTISGGATTTGNAYFAGSVGVGTTTPWGLLSVNGTSALGSAPQFVVGSSTKTDFIVTNAGNVGIGDTAPAVKLSIKGASGSDVFQIRNTSGGGYIYQYSTAGTSGSIGVWDGVSAGLPLALNPVGGNVGIGTTAPGGKLAVQVNSSYDVVTGLNSGAFTTYRTGSGAWWHVGKHDSIDALVFSNGATPTSTVNMAISTAGNVGIGTTTPMAALTVQGNNGVYGSAAYFSAGTGSNVVALGTHASVSTIQALTSVNAVASLAVNPGGGNVGIGTTTPGEKLEVNGNIKLGVPGYKAYTWATDGSGMFFRDDTNTRYPFKIDAGAYDNAIVIDSTGEVGIGNATPGKTLDVTGTGRFSSTLTLTGSPTCTGAQALQTNGSGDIACGTISVGGVSSAGGWTTNNVGSVTLSTTTDRVAIGATSTPYAKLSIMSGGTATTTLAILPATSQTANIIDIYNTSGVLTSVMNASGYLGIGTTTPERLLEVSGNSDGGIRSTTYTDTATVGGNLLTRKARGTSALPTAVAADDVLGGIYGAGFTSAGTFGTNVAAIRLHASQAYTATNQGSYLSFFTTPDNSTSRAEAVRITSAGSVGIGTTSPMGKFSINTGADRGIVFGQDADFSTYNALSLNGNLTDAGNTGFFGGASSDNNLYLQGANAMQFRTGGANVRMAITSAGNVGIGTTSPTALLALQSNSTAGTLLDIANVDTGGHMYRILSTGSGNAPGAGTLGFYDFGGTPGYRMVISPTGNVGIGTTTPSLGTLAIASAYSSTTLPIVVSGALGTGGIRYLFGGYDGSGSLRSILGLTDSDSTGELVFNTKASGKIHFTSAGSITNEFVTFDSQNGNVGIGTTTPGYTLGVAGNIGVNGNINFPVGAIAPSGQGIFNSAGTTLTLVGGTTGTYFNNNANNATNVSILNGGSVGVGTTSPATTFSVSGNGYVTGGLGIGKVNTTSGLLEIADSSNLVQVYGAGAIEIARTNDDSAFIDYKNSTAEDYDFRTQLVGSTNTLGFTSSTTTNILNLKGNGNVGIGTANPSLLLSVVGTTTSAYAPLVKIGNASDSRYVKMGVYLSTDGNQRPYTQAYHTSSDANTWDYLINPAGGNVGIGTSSPTAKLHIGGLSSNMYFDIGGNSFVGQTAVTTHVNGNVGSMAFGISDGGGQVGMFVNNQDDGTYNSQYISFKTAQGGITAATEWMRVAEYGNVGIGTTSPQTKLSISGADSDNFGQLTIKSTGNDARISLYNANGSSATGRGDIIMSKSTGYEGMRFMIGGTDKMILDENGYLGVGTTTPGSVLTIGNTANVNKLFVGYYGTGYGVGAVFQPANDTVKAVSFLNAAGTEVGSIQTTNAATTYNTTSDRRTKEGIATTTLGLDALMRLPIREFSFIQDTSHATTTGFIAQELHNIFPWAVTTNGDDGEVALGTTTPWSVDYGRITPLIAKAVQDLNNKVDDWTSRSIDLSATTSAVELTTSVTASTTAPWLGAFSESSATFKGALSLIGDTVVHVLGRAVYATTGIFDKVFAKEVFAGKVQAEELCLGATCVTEAQLQALLANANSSQGGGGGGGGAPPAPEEDPDTESPVITLQGSNPATTTVGALYVDLGAIVTDNVSENLGYTVSVNGATSTAPDVLYIDTTEAGTHTILFSATDQAGNVGTSERTVVVE